MVNPECSEVAAGVPPSHGPSEGGVDPRLVQVGEWSQRATQETHNPPRGPAPDQRDCQIRDGGWLLVLCLTMGGTGKLRGRPGLLCAKPAAPTQIDEHEHDDRHAFVESHVVITTDTYPIDSRARGVGWVGRVVCPCLKGTCSPRWEVPKGTVVLRGARHESFRSSWPPVCARPARPLRCFVRCRGTAHHLRQVRQISWLLSRRSGFPSENDQLTSRRPPNMIPLDSCFATTAGRISGTKKDRRGPLTREDHQGGWWCETRARTPMNTRSL